MTATLDEALTTHTAAELEADMIDDLAADGADVQGWDDVAPQRLLVSQNSRARAHAEGLRRAAVLGGYLLRAREAGPSWVAEALRWYGVAKVAATRSVHTFRLACPASAGPYTIASSSGELVAQADDATLFVSSNPAAVVVPSGGTALCQFTARTAGTSGNQLPGFVSRLIVGKPGLTVSNAPGTGSSRDVVARDEETDEQAIARALGRWGTLAGVLTREGWRYVLLTPEIGGVSTLTRIFVDDANPDGPGSLRIYVANAAGAPTAEELAAAQAQATRYTIAGAGLVTVLGAVERVVSFSAQLLTDGSNTLAAAQAATAVSTLVSSLEANTLYFYAVTEALTSPAGVTTILSIDLAGDVTKTLGEVFVVSPTITQV